MRYLENFDEILQYFNSLSGEFNAESVICKAEVLAKTFREIASHKSHSNQETKTKEEEVGEESTSKEKEGKEGKRDYLDNLTPEELQLLV